jgi:hypothetical protein
MSTPAAFRDRVIITGVGVPQLQIVNGIHSFADREIQRKTYHFTHTGTLDESGDVCFSRGDLSPIDVSVARFSTNLRAGLTRCRATLPDMVIVLVTPNNTYWRASNVHERFNRVVRRCAAEFDCVFIDLYALYWQKPAASGDWCVDGTHPTPESVVMYMDTLCETIFPH